MYLPPPRGGTLSQGNKMKYSKKIQKISDDLIANILQCVSDNMERNEDNMIEDFESNPGTSPFVVFHLSPSAVIKAYSLLFGSMLDQIPKEGALELILSNREMLLSLAEQLRNLQNKYKTKGH